MFWPRAISPCSVKGADGYEASVALPAYGPYRLENMIDFTSDQEPGGGWSNAVSNALPGFSGKADRRVAKSIMFSKR